MIVESFRNAFRKHWDGNFGPLPSPKRWVFIVGCYNSGTTLLHNVLATHPNVGSMPWEGQFYTDQLPLPTALGLPRLWAIRPELFQLREEDGRDIRIERLKRQWGGRYNDLSRPVLIEKTPTNAGRTRWLQKHFEDAFFVGIIRNGFAVAEGIRRKAGHSLELGARQWRVCNEIMLEDFDHLDHSLLVHYEALTDQPDAQMARVAEFIGLDPAPISGVEMTWNIHGDPSKIRNMNSRSLSTLSAEEVNVIRTEAGTLLEQFGYDARTGTEPVLHD